MIRVREREATEAGTKWVGSAVGFGRELRNERERLGVPLDTLAEATKVPVRHLRALESDHWSELPGGVFTKGIVRGYCKFLGLPENQWLERLAGSAEQAAAEPDWAEFAQNVKRTRVQTSPAARQRWWGVALMVLALIALTWAAWRYELADRLPNFVFPGRNKTVTRLNFPGPSVLLRAAIAAEAGARMGKGGSA